MAINEKNRSVTFPIRVLPRSSRCEVMGIQEGTLKLKITAPPVDGRANEECLRLLAEALKIKKSQITIRSGHQSRNKIIAVAGLSAAALQAKLAELQGAAPGSTLPKGTKT